MKFAKHHKLLGNSNAENAEKDAEKTGAQKLVFLLRVSSAFSAPLR
jgi:hypothetical protein